MKNRSQDLLRIRLGVKTTTLNDNMRANEYFQNATIRPAIQFQHELLIASFKNYINKHKNVFYALTTDKKIAYIDTAIHKDIKFRNALKGILIGVFTVEEYETYINDSSALNKRMMNFVIEHLKDNVLRFDKNTNLEISA